MGGFPCFTCSSSRALTPEDMERVRSRMDGVRDVFPSSKACFVVDPQGEVIAQSGDDPTVPAAIMNQVSLLKRSTVEFGEAMGGQDCPAVHIKGNSHILSCYNVGPSVMAVLSQEHATSVEMFDASAADEQMRPLLVGLAEALRER